MMKNGIDLFYCKGILGCRVIRFWFMQIRGLVTLQQGHKMMWNHKICNLWENIYSTALKFCRLDVLQELHIVIVVMSPQQHTPSQTSTFPKQTFLSLYCVMSTFVHTPTEWTSRANNTSLKRETLILLFGWRGPTIHCVAMEMSQWT